MVLREREGGSVNWLILRYYCLRLPASAALMVAAYACFAYGWIAKTIARGIVDVAEFLEWFFFKLRI